MECSVLECKNKAIARSKISNDVYCVECALSVVKQHGPQSIVSLAGAKFPWRYPIEGQCPNCGINYNTYLMGRGGECPKCRVDLPIFNKRGDENDEV